jgi:hypothetical protein
VSRHRLGAWVCGSGNAVEVAFVRDAVGLAYVAFEWDAPPPLSPMDQHEYEHRILPDVVRLVQEYTESPGPALVVTA